MTKFKHQVATLVGCHLLLLFQKCISTTAQINQDEPSIFNETSVLSADSIPLDEPPTKCQYMRIPFCEKVDYNKTMFPNDLGHKTPQEIESDIMVYDPLVSRGCSPNIRLFLCTVFAPICFEHDNGPELKLGPCKSLCESAKQGCEPQLKAFNLVWPEALNCDKFPDGRRKGVLCVGNDSHNTLETYERDTSSGIRMDPGFVCPKNFEKESYTLHFNGKTYNNCAMPCDDVYLDRGSSSFVRLSVGITAIICIISSLFACMTFLIDRKRFQYPLRPIIIIAFCQLMVATCYLVGYLSSNKIACNDPERPPVPNVKMIRTMTIGNRKGSCTLLFMALYFFQMSAVFWWVMMTISWFMIAKLKWAPESINGHSRYFHVTSWALPALMTLYLSVLGYIEGDPLSGACYISTSNQGSIANFLLTPVAICLVIGIVLLSLGFKSIWDDRVLLRSISKDQTHEHYKLIIRIGLYSLLFVLFTATFLGSHYHEQGNQTLWKFSWLSNICKDRDFSIPCPSRDYRNQGPHYVVFMIRYFASMAMGLATMGFMLSEKTFRAYKEVVETYPLET